MKKKILMAVSYLLVVVLAVTGTVAYLQDTDSDVNVMTLGNVKIEQIEQEWNEAKTELVDFTQAKPLYPYVGQLGWENKTDKDGAYRRFTMNNVVDKYVSVKNTGKSDAYVRTFIALEMGDYTYNEFTMVGISNNAANGAEFQFDGAWEWTNDFVAKIDGKNYNVMVAVHKDAVEPGETTIPSLLQVYLSKDAGNEEVEKLDGNDNGTYDILVFSEAVQTNGFTDAKSALNEAFGNPDNSYHPWGDGADLPVLLASQDELKQAIADGEKNVLVKGAVLDEKMKLGSDVNVTFVDCTITGPNAWGYVNNATFQNCTFDSGSDNAAIHFDRLYGELVVNNCKFVSGKVQIGNGDSASAVFNNCEFGETLTTSIWGEKGMRFYCETTFNQCEFNNRVVIAGSNGLALNFNDCTMNGGTDVYYVDNTDGIIRGGNVPAVTIK